MIAFSFWGPRYDSGRSVSTESRLIVRHIEPLPGSQWFKQVKRAPTVVDPHGQDTGGEENVRVDVTGDVTDSLIAGRDINIHNEPSELLKGILDMISGFKEEIEGLKESIDRLRRDNQEDKYEGNTETDIAPDSGPLGPEKDQWFFSMGVPDGGWPSEDAANGIAGLDAERLVMEFEYQHLLASGREDLANRVSLVQSPSIGYDLDSFDKDGKPRRIEIKALAKSNSHSFIDEYLHRQYFESTEPYGDTFLFAFVCRVAGRIVIEFIQNPWDDEERAIEVAIIG